MLSTKAMHIYRRWFIRKSNWVYRLALIPTAPSVVAFVHLVTPSVFSGTDNISGMDPMTRLIMCVFLGVGAGLIYALYIHLFSLIANLLDHFRPLGGLD